MAEKFYDVQHNKLTKADVSKSQKKDFHNWALEVRMFHVGIGELILLVLPNPTQQEEKQVWIIDCGVKSKKKNAILGEKLKEYLKTEKLVINALVASHPHIDHGGAFASLLAAEPKMARKLDYYRSGTTHWGEGQEWISELEKELKRLGTRLRRHTLDTKPKKVRIADDLWAYFFAGIGASAYYSLFLQIRYHDTRLLFTGDSYCPYEKSLLEEFDDDFFRSDLLKVTHHGSSDGTNKSVVKVIKHGIAIASTADDPKNTLERDTLLRLGGHGRPRRVFETLIDGDIVVKTDGIGIWWDKGILYSIDFKKSGEFAKAMGVTTKPFNAVNKNRTTKDPNDDCQ